MWGQLGVTVDSGCGHLASCEFAIGSYLGLAACCDFEQVTLIPIAPASLAVIYRDLHGRGSAVGGKKGNNICPIDSANKLVGSTLDFRCQHHTNGTVDVFL